MEQKGWLDAEWRSSENNRRAKYYRLTPQGRRLLRQELSTWQRYTAAVGALLVAVAPDAAADHG